MTINGPTRRPSPPFAVENLHNVTLERAKSTRHCHKCARGIPKGTLCAAVKKARGKHGAHGGLLDVRKNLCPDCAMELIPAASQRLMDMFNALGREPRVTMKPEGRKSYPSHAPLSYGPQPRMPSGQPGYKSPWIQDRGRRRQAARERSVYSTMPRDEDLERNV